MPTAYYKAAKFLMRSCASNIGNGKYFYRFLYLETVQKLLETSTPYKCSYANYFVIRRKSQA